MRRSTRKRSSTNKGKEAAGSVGPPRKEVVLKGPPVDPFGVLPAELFMMCLSYLNGKDLARASCVSKGWSYVANDNLLWKRLFVARWPLAAKMAANGGRSSGEENGAGPSTATTTTTSTTTAAAVTVDWKELFADHYDEEKVFSHPRWTRYYRAKTNRSNCWHCRHRIEQGSLRFVPPIFEHQTPPWAHASCDILFNVYDDHFDPNRPLNAWQRNVFATHESDLDELERMEILAWIRDGMDSEATPPILGPALVATPELTRKRPQVKAKRKR